MKLFATLVVLALVAAATAGGKKKKEKFDVIVVGGGTAGLSAAIGATRDKPNTKVLLLEKGEALGGTSIRSGGVLWIPNNEDKAALAGTNVVSTYAGSNTITAQNRDDTLKYMARLSHPTKYDPNAADLGLGQRWYEQLTTYYDEGASIMKWLRDNTLINWRVWNDLGPFGLLPAEPDYYPNLPENTSPFGTSVDFMCRDPTDASIECVPEGRSGGGASMIDWLGYAAGVRGVDIRLNHEVVGLRTNGADTKVKGVKVIDDEGDEVEIKARKGVVFASGGFSKNRDLVDSFSVGPFLGSGCAAETNTGTFVDIATRHGLKLENMNRAWFMQNIAERVFLQPDVFNFYNIFFLQGDTAISVNRYGVRVHNEKGTYHDRGEVHFNVDNTNGILDYPNRVLINVFDSTDLNFHWGFAGQILPTPDCPGCFFGDFERITGATISELVTNIQARLALYTDRTGNFDLDTTFEANLNAEIATWNNDASTTGVDSKFGRGESVTDLKWHATCLFFHPAIPAYGLPSCLDITAALPNRVMRPFDGGPYYAVLLIAGAQDTNGGPAINSGAQILRQDGTVMENLYGAGNCVGSPAGKGYWGAGGTLGPALVFGHIAGRNAATNDDIPEDGEPLAAGSETLVAGGVAGAAGLVVGAAAAVGAQSLGAKDSKKRRRTKRDELTDNDLTEDTATQEI